MVLMQNEITEKEIYTSLEEAKDEIWRRWNDNDLRKKVDAYCGEVPAVFKNEPRSVLDRNVMSPNNELFHFLKLAEQVALKPLGWEYRDDKFCSRNADKLGLAKMAFFHKRNKKGEALFSYEAIADCTVFDGQRFSRIKTMWGEDFVGFHHRLLTEHSPVIDVADGSAWYKSNGKRASKYYSYFLALFICHGILFENFVTNGYEAEFVHKVVNPSLEKIIGIFGVKPLVVPLEPPEDAPDFYWRCYPAELEAEVSRCLSQCNAKDSSAHRHAGRYVGKDSGHYEIKGNRK